ncbi:MAG: tRNA (adenosine(37)-N6)-dimethylallyltransferase MiaA [Alistipes sp.]
MTDRHRLILLVGATGSGKTDLSICLAQHYGAPILSVDSRQIYRGLSIGTAQPTEFQQQSVDHHFVASVDLTEDFSCGKFETQALALLKQLFIKHSTVLAVGGSGLYAQALCNGMDDLPEVDTSLRDLLRARLTTEGIAKLAAELKDLDPTFYDVVDHNNSARILRALEICLQTGRPYSSFRTGAVHQRDFDIIKIGIDMDRTALYARIDQRVDTMIASGLEQEARKVYPFRQLHALQTVGYKEMFDYFDGKISLAEAIVLIKRNSRHYAKRQFTWFRRDPAIRWFSPQNIEAIFEYIG